MGYCIKNIISLENLPSLFPFFQAAESLLLLLMLLFYWLSSLWSDGVLQFSRYCT